MGVDVCASKKKDLMDRQTGTSGVTEGGREVRKSPLGNHQPHARFESNLLWEHTRHLIRVNPHDLPKDIHFSSPSSTPGPKGHFLLQPQSQV